MFPIRRRVFDLVYRHLSTGSGGRAAVLLGPRQVGKTTILKQIADRVLADGLPASNLTFFDFSDDRVVEAVSPRTVVNVNPPGFSSQHPRIYLFDEIQSVPRWDAWLKGAVDEARRNASPPTWFVLTGSAASSLRTGAIESGPGRWDEIAIEGLTFTEFLELSSVGGSTPRGAQMLRRYLEMGGFPEHVTSDSPREVRRRIREDIADRAILRDLRREGVEIDRVRRLFTYLTADSGSTWHQANRARDLDANRKSVGDWLELLESTRLLLRLERDRGPKKKAHVQLAGQPRIYACDHGLVTAFSSHPEPFEDSQIRGRVFETVVFRHLRELARGAEGELGFARHDDNEEIDFVLRYPKRSVGIEVTSSTEPKPRKLARAADAMRLLGLDLRLLIHGGLLSGKSEDVELVPLHEFLAAPERYAGAVT
jgi:uncharacterized protein